MFTNKFWTRLLLAGALMALLMTTGCGMEVTIQGPEEQALAEQGNKIMAGFQDGNFQAVYDMMSRDAQQAVDVSLRLVGNTVDLKSLIMDSGNFISGWNMERADLFIKGGKMRGTLEGKVDYIYGKSGKVHMELEMQDGTWKLNSINLEAKGR